MEETPWSVPLFAVLFGAAVFVVLGAIGILVLGDRWRRRRAPGAQPEREDDRAAW